MFPLTLLAATSLIALANAIAIPRASTPATYAEGYLEPYKTYHIRYLALHCQDKHDTPFFDACCHPLLSTENLVDNRKPECTPSEAASSSASVAEPTSTVVPSGDDGDDDDCEDDDESSTADAAPTPAPAPAPPKNVAPDPATTSGDSQPSSVPEPKPSSAPQPKPSSAPQPKPSPTPAPGPPPPPPSNNDGGLSDIIGQVFQGGIATFFDQNGVAGNCGEVHSDDALIVALPTETYANGAHCGKKVKIQDTVTGHIEIATVADSCPTCNNPQCLDLSTGLYDKFASRDQGVFPIKWGFLQD